MNEQWKWEIRSEGGPIIVYSLPHKGQVDKRTICTVHPLSAKHTPVITAALDLLAALESIVESLAGQDDEGLIEHAEPMRQARAAIAKATGAA